MQNGYLQDECFLYEKEKGGFSANFLFPQWTGTLVCWYTKAHWIQISADPQVWKEKLSNNSYSFEGIYKAMVGDVDAPL